MVGNVSAKLNPQIYAGKQKSFLKKSTTTRSLKDLVSNKNMLNSSKTQDVFIKSQNLLSNVKSPISPLSPESPKTPREMEVSPREVENKTLKDSSSQSPLPPYETWTYTYYYMDKQVSKNEYYARIDYINYCSKLNI